MSSNDSNLESLSGLAAFARAAEAEGFAAAGRRLGISASAVGKSIARLEKNLGVRLFNRTTRSVSLTEEGEILYGKVARILDELSEAEAQFSGLRSQPKGRLLISAPVALGQYKIVPALPQLWEEYPDLRFEVDLDDRQIHIVEEGYDLAIRMSSSFEDSRLVSKRLGGQKLVTCAAPAYLEKFGEPGKPEDLAYHRCIGFKFSGTNRIAPWRFQDRDKPYSINPLGAFTFNNNSAMLDTARAGMGVTQLPAYVVEHDISSHRLRPVLDDYSPNPVDILALWPQTKHMAPKLRALIDFLYDLFNS